MYFICYYFIIKIQTKRVEMKRRDFFKNSIVAAAALSSTAVLADVTGHPRDNRKIANIAFPEKRPMITYSDRPPLLEAPRSVFTQTFTPNDQFFVRWHMPDIPQYIDPKKFTITIDGLVDAKYTITLEQLKTEFEQVEVNAVVQCGGNSRSAFHPIPGGIQWGSGAMGCAKWKGVRLRDILHRAGLSKHAEWIGFNGLEKAAYYETPNFVREIKIDELDDHVIVAYEMNGEDLPYLNGYPCRLVLPGWYSDSWVKMLSNITVTDKYKSLFFMDKAYRIADNKTEGETPDKLFPRTKPIEQMNVKSLIGYPENKTQLNYASEVVVRGVAFDDGTGIKKVDVSIDGGKTWKEAELDNGENGRYAFRAFRFNFKPKKYGAMKIMSRATNLAGDVQRFAHQIPWNRGGYKYNGIDVVNVEIV